MTYIEINDWRVTSIVSYCDGSFKPLPFSAGVAIEHAYAPGCYLVIAFVYPKETDDDDYEIECYGKRIEEACKSAADKATFESLIKMASILVHTADKETDE